MAEFSPCWHCRWHYFYKQLCPRVTYSGLRWSRIYCWSKVQRLFACCLISLVSLLKLFLSLADWTQSSMGLAVTWWLAGTAVQTRHTRQTTKTFKCTETSWIEGLAWCIWHKGLWSAVIWSSAGVRYGRFDQNRNSKMKPKKEAALTLRLLVTAAVIFQFAARLP